MVSQSKVPDVIILTLEEETLRTAGIAAPIPSSAFDKERLCVISHTPHEFDPYTVSASISFLRRSKSVFFVMPRLEQSELWANRIINGLNKDKQLTPADRVQEYAAVSLLGHRNVSIVASVTW